MKRDNKIKLLKFLMFILLAITILSCNEPEDKPDDFWERTSEPLDIISIAVANNGDIWTGNYNLTPIYLSTLFLSTNNGNTWVQKNSFPPIQSRLSSIAVNPINGYIFVGTEFHNGVFRSTDNGESWAKITPDNMAIQEIVITPYGGIYILVKYSGVSSSFAWEGVYYSNDNGNTWINKNNLSVVGYIAVIVTSCIIGKDGILYIGTTQGIYRSTDGGDTWLPSYNYINEFVRGVTVSDNGSVFAATMSNGVLKSTDGGNWVQVNTGLNVEDANCIIYNPITRDIFVSDRKYNSKIYRSTDLGESWSLENSGIPNNQYVYAFAFNHNTGQMYVATTNGIYRSRNYP